jgi:hypothetical protein
LVFRVYIRCSFYGFLRVFLGILFVYLEAHVTFFDIYMALFLIYTTLLVKKKKDLGLWMPLLDVDC